TSRCAITSSVPDASRRWHGPVTKRKAGTTKAGSACGPTRRLLGVDLLPGGFLRGLAAATTTGTHRVVELLIAQRGRRIVRPTTRRVPSIGAECGRVRSDERD